jgi:hypothetical protein
LKGETCPVQPDVLPPQGRHLPVVAERGTTDCVMGVEHTSQPSVRKPKRKSRIVCVACTILAGVLFP